MNPLGQSPKFTATAADPNTADTLTYTWEKTGGRWHNAPQTGPTGNVAYWVQPSGGQSGRYTITVTVSDGVASTNDATTSMTIEVPSCTILVDGNSHVNPADGQSGFLAAGGTGRLSFRKGDHEACPIPGMANFTTDPAAHWITASGFGTLSDPVYTHYIEYTVAENTTHEARTTSIGTPYPSWIWEPLHPGGAGGRTQARRRADLPDHRDHVHTDKVDGGGPLLRQRVHAAVGQDGLWGGWRVQGQRPVALAARARADLRLQRG